MHPPICLTDFKSKLSKLIPKCRRRKQKAEFHFDDILCHSAEQPQPHRWSRDFQSDSAQSGAVRRQQKAGGRQRRASIQQKQNLLPRVQAGAAHVGAGSGVWRVPRDLQQTRAEPIPVEAERNRHPGGWMRAWMRAWGPAVGRRVLAEQRRSEMRVRLLDGRTFRGFAAPMRRSLSSFYLQLKCTIRFSCRDKRIHYHVFRAFQSLLCCVVLWDIQSNLGLFVIWVHQR